MKNHVTSDLSDTNSFIPPALLEFALLQVKAGGYVDLQEYIRDLIRRDQVESSEPALEALLYEGLETEVTELTEKDIQSLRKYASKLEKERKAR